MTTYAVCGPARTYGWRILRDPVLPERLLAKLWRAKTGSTLQTTDGRRVRVIYPGRPAPGHGPDFQDAVLELDGRALNGPVELHRVPADWSRHGHHRDPAYDNVVLHVVSASPETLASVPAAGVVPMLSPTAPRPSIPQAPRLPTIVLPDQRAGAADRTGLGLLHELAVLSQARLLTRLHAAGMARFNERIATAAKTIATHGVDQALLAGIMDGLGYSENRTPFKELAQRVPFFLLLATARTAPAGQRTTLLANLLLGGSGLDKPTKEWIQFIGTPPMLATAWRTSGVRPSNHPRRRLWAVAHYVAQAQDGLAAWLRPHALRGPRALIEALLVDLGSGPAVVGESRAMEIATNAVLPILASAALEARDTPSAKLLSDAYETLPALPKNTVLREAMTMLGQHDRLRLTACHQQGLMRLYQQAAAPQVHAVN